ncbi:hypothetical protein C8Q73DRAFT_323571 [Cubamyces lactineus]|nr:hypothetical protein C8Q73DRAFT_323571 [Cubamyces lactineus]
MGSKILSTVREFNWKLWLSTLGSTLAVYGAIVPPNTTKSVEPPSVRITLDGQSGLFGTAVAQGDHSPVYGYAYFGLSNVTAGQHLLEIFVEHGDMENNWPFILDYIEYAPLSDSTSISPASTTATSTPHPTDSAVKKSKPAVGLIVGGVIGGVVGLVLLLGAAYLWFSRRQRRTSYAYQSAKEVDLFDPEPRPITPTAPSILSSSTAGNGSRLALGSSTPAPTSAHPSSEGAHAPRAPLSSLPHMVQAVSMQGSPSAPYSPAPSSAPAPPASRRPENASGKGDPRVPSRPRPPMAGASATIYHADSGIRFAPPDPLQEPPPEDTHSDIAILEVPPEYTEH